MYQEERYNLRDGMNPPSTPGGIAGITPRVIMGGSAIIRVHRSGFREALDRRE